tara:strand:- start:90 stop:446 length:357 start_codon:yes stop_codon:yes gene_type:complete
MPKVTIDSVRGINQTSGTGFEVSGAPITRTLHAISAGDTSANTFSTVSLPGVGTYTMEDGIFVGQIKTLVVTVSGNVRVKDSGAADIGGNPITGGGSQENDVYLLVYAEGSPKWTLLT